MNIKETLMEKLITRENESNDLQNRINNFKDYYLELTSKIITYLNEFKAKNLVKYEFNTYDSDMPLKIQFQNLVFKMSPFYSDRNNDNMYVIFKLDTIENNTNYKTKHIMDLNFSDIYFFYNEQKKEWTIENNEKITKLDCNSFLELINSFL